MARTEGDTWDLASSVGATATMVAAARAAASRLARPVINDPFAEPLVRAVGLDVFTKLAGGDLDADDIEKGVGFPRMVDTFAARARYFDDYFAAAGHAGVRHVVIVASGLDARPYRLRWPIGTTVYEIDQPEVIAFKTATLSKIGAAPPRSCAPWESISETTGRRRSKRRASTLRNPRRGWPRECSSVSSRRRPRCGCSTPSRRCPARAAGWPPTTERSPDPRRSRRNKRGS